jgi:hypothetical protein
MLLLLALSGCDLLDAAGSLFLYGCAVPHRNSVFPFPTAVGSPDEQIYTKDKIARIGPRCPDFHFGWLACNANPFVADVGRPLYLRRSGRPRAHSGTPRPQRQPLFSIRLGDELGALSGESPELRLGIVGGNPVLWVFAQPP